MAPISNPRVIFAEIPTGVPEPGKHLVLKEGTIDLENVPLNGGFLTKTICLSPEPYMRGRMRDPSVPSYGTPLKLGGPVIGFGVVQVLRSEKEGLEPGTYMYGMTPWEAYTVQPYVEGRWDFDAHKWPAYTFNMDSLALQPVPDPQGAFPLSTYVGALGTPGLTAYAGFEEYAHAEAGQTIFVSAGAGSVGSMVCQLAKRKGLKVIASCGSDSKVQYLEKELGVDVAFNYKTTKAADVLAKHGPINIYWDNVGGETLDAAIDALTLNGRILSCGYVTTYNQHGEKYGVQNLDQFFGKRIMMQGFLVPDLVAKGYAAKMYGEIPALIAQGIIKSDEIILKGIESAPGSFQVLFQGGNTGKLVIMV